MGGVTGGHQETGAVRTGNNMAADEIKIALPQGERGI